MDFSSVVNTYSKLISVASRQYKDRIATSVLSKEDLYQEGQMLLWKVYLKYKDKAQNNPDEFKAIFVSSLYRHMYTLVNNQKTTISLDNLLVDADFSWDDSLAYLDDTFGNMWVECVLQQVRDLLADNEVALEVLSNILNPSSAVIWEMHMDYARKKTISMQGSTLRVNEVNMVKVLHIQRALKITEKKMANTMSRIKAVYRQAEKILDTDV